MTKDVLLSIKGLQIGENEQNDTIEVISPGDYYFRNGKHFFMYEEVMEGQKESTRNMIKIGRASCREKCRSRWSPYH